MKKLIIILTALLLCSAAKGQVYLGGGFGITSSYHGRGISLYIAPDVAYRINNSFVTGAQLSYRTGYPGLGFTPYIRWHAAPLGDSVSLFLSASMPCVFQEDYTTINFRIRPGATVRVSDRLYMVAHIGAFGYGTTYCDGEKVSSGWFASLDRDYINVGFCIML